DIYNGETYNANLERKGWAAYGYDDRDWSRAAILDHPKDILVASQGLPVRATEEITPIDMFTTPEGDTVLDLGQNMVGWVRMKVQGERGDQVTLQFAEVLDKDGNFYTTNLRAAKATDVYLLQGGTEEVFEPHFTFHGFRYVKVSGYPGNLSLDKITGVVIHSDMKPTGTFTCSDSLINKLQENIRWGQRGNFLDVPTDCPQRDERLGWTGDAQVFSPTAAFNYDVAAFYTKWLKDLAADQSENGSVPHVIPDNQRGRGGATGWGDAAVIVPWTVYQAYGDVRVLEEQYPSMKAWVDFMQDKAGEDLLWNNPKDWHWGDWLAFHSSKPDYAGSVTEKDLIATAYYHYSTSLVSKTATLIGKTDEAATYQQLAEKIKEAFIAEFITPNGRLVSHTQTAYALAISFDLIPKDLLQKSATYFAQDVEKFGHLTTGFLGTPLLCSALSKIGRDDLAFMLLHRKKFPSWLYPVTQGATTIWERWDTQKPDGSITKGMNSFNHYAYGAIGEWLYTHVAGLGIDPGQPGYQHILLHPHPGPGLSHASVTFRSLYGEVASGWEIKDENLVYAISIPPNTQATVTLPQATLAQVRVNQEQLSSLRQAQPVQVKDQVTLTLGSGEYTFAYPINDIE
ncbi:MAG: family 78 glycoside hydrolase catalytic domain, partial [Bacteroidota bacterium]